MLVLVLGSVALATTSPCDTTFDTSLLVAAYEGNLAWMRHILLEGEPPDAENYESCKTPLDMAIEGGKADAVRLLIAVGADIEADYYMSDVAPPSFAVTLASERGDLDIVRILLDAGASPLGIGDYEGRFCTAHRICAFSPLAAAAASGNGRLVDLLLERGGEPKPLIDVKGEERPFGYWYTPFQRALFANHPQIAEQLAPYYLTPFERAALTGDLSKVKTLVSKGAKVNARGLSGCTPLALASWRGRLETARYLLAAGADSQARCEEPPGRPEKGYTPLELAALGGWPKVVRLLSRGRPEPRALLLAVKDYDPYQQKSSRKPDPSSRRLEVVEFLIEKLKTAVVNKRVVDEFVYPIEQYGDDKPLDTLSSPLEAAARAGWTAALERMFAARPSYLDLKGPYGHWLLARAAESGNLGTVRFLVAVGAAVNDPLAPDFPSQALGAAVRGGYLHIARFLLDEGAKPSPDPLPKDRTYEWTADDYRFILWPPLLEAAAHGDLAMTRLLVEHGARLGPHLTGVPPDWKDRSRYTGVYDFEYSMLTPLELAVYRGHSAIVRYLVESAAGRLDDPDQAQRLLMTAVKQRNPEMVSLLLSQGADPTARSALDRSLLHEAPDGQIARQLLAAGVNPNTRSRDGKTPLHAAVAWRRHDVLRALLEAGADPNAADFVGKTPLLYAIEIDDYEAARTLTLFGATLPGKDSIEHAYWNKSEMREAVQRVVELAKKFRDHRLALLVANLTGHQEIVCEVVRRERSACPSDEGQTWRYWLRENNCSDSP